MASTVYTKGILRIINGTTNWTSGSFKVMLCDASYTPDPDHQFVSSITGVGGEISGVTGYTGGFGGSGRLALTTIAPAEDATNDLIKFDADDVLWSSLGPEVVTVTGCAVIQEVTSDADSPLIAYLDFTDKDTGDGAGGAAPFPVNWGGNGVFQADMSP